MTLLPHRGPAPSIPTLAKDFPIAASRFAIRANRFLTPANRFAGINPAATAPPTVSQRPPTASQAQTFVPKHGPSFGHAPHPRPLSEKENGEPDTHALPMIPPRLFGEEVRGRGARPQNYLLTIASSRNRRSMASVAFSRMLKAFVAIVLPLSSVGLISTISKHTTRSFSSRSWHRFSASER